jgi:hypothetical protein
MPGLPANEKEGDMAAAVVAATWRGVAAAAVNSAFVAEPAVPELGHGL